MASGPLSPFRGFGTSPFQSVRREMNRRFDDRPGAPASVATSVKAGMLMPRLDVRERSYRSPLQASASGQGS